MSALVIGIVLIAVVLGVVLFFVLKKPTPTTPVGPTNLPPIPSPNRPPQLLPVSPPVSVPINALVYWCDAPEHCTPTRSMASLLLQKSANSYQVTMHFDVISYAAPDNGTMGVPFHLQLENVDNPVLLPRAFWPPEGSNLFLEFNPFHITTDASVVEFPPSPYIVVNDKGEVRIRPMRSAYEFPAGVKSVQFGPASVSWTTENLGA